uniref:Uncharacterized protein n=1 Tax=Anguilla anguilla TaxID=7936 RepID=A0A0E9RH45_ANGAN
MLVFGPTTIEIHNCRIFNTFSLLIMLFIVFFFWILMDYSPS